MKCSIIVSYCRSVERAVRLYHSLENQDFPHDEYEIIFVNYGEIDGLSEYIADHPSRVRVRCFTVSGARVSQAKNQGIRRASGELLIFLNGDEIATRSFVSGHYDAYKKHGKPVMQFGLTKQVFEDNDEVFFENREILRNGIRYWLTEPETYGLDKHKSYYYIKDIRLKMLEPYRYDFDKVKYKMIFTQTSGNRGLGIRIPYDEKRRRYRL